VTILDRRTFLAIAASGMLAEPLKSTSASVLRPEDYGARGDGLHNDSDAFTKMSAEITAKGGGTVVLAPRATYLVGRQRPEGTRAFTAQSLLEIHGLTRPLTIIGNGASLKASPGLRFGAFDRTTDRPIRRPMPNYDESLIAAPYRAMIVVRGCRAPVAIQNIELDGNISRLRVGGQWGDVGWQVPGSGLLLSDNLDQEIVENVLTHHHPLDGLIIDGAMSRNRRSRISWLTCRANGRQGASIVGGRGYDFEDCEFSATGRSLIHSSPGAGVDLEPEGGKSVRDLTFVRCKFVDNAGAGLVADTGDSKGARFSDCLFIGTTAWSAWPSKPGFLFDRCTFAGSVVHAFPSKDPAQAAQFLNCRFTDDPRLSPTGRLYVGGSAGNGIVNLEPSDNVLFGDCRFILEHEGVLPWSWRAIYRDCIMTQRSRTPAMTKGRFLGRTVIDGPVDLYGSMIAGTVILNGRRIPLGPVGNDFSPW
jgi:hypothetical protein